MATSWVSGWQPSLAVTIGAAVGYSLAICFILFCIARSTPTSWKDLVRTPKVKLAALASYGSCLLSVIWFCVSVFALKTERSLHNCRTAVLGNSYFYIAAKLGMYWFYLERGFLSYQLSTRQKKYGYIGFTIVFGAAIAIMGTLLGVYPRAQIDEEGRCRIGMSEALTIACAIIDGASELSLTGTFLYPVWRAKFAAARAVAARSAMASITTFTATLGVFCVILLLDKGKINIWILDGCWTFLFTLNAAVVFIITHRGKEGSSQFASTAVQTGTDIHVVLGSMDKS